MYDIGFHCDNAIYCQYFLLIHNIKRMEKKELLIFVIICIILIVVVAYAIIDVIDNKLNKMPIKLPTVNPPKVVINMCDGKAVDQHGNDVTINKKDNNANTIVTITAGTDIKKTNNTNDTNDTKTVDSGENSHASSFDDSGSSQSSDSKDTSHMTEHEFVPVIQYSDIVNNDAKNTNRPTYIKEGFSIRGHNIDNYV